MNFKYCMLCLKLTCLILLKYHMQYVLSKSAEFLCRVFVFVFPNILKTQLICWSTVLSLNNVLQCMYKILGQLVNIALCIFTLQFSGIFTAICCILLGKPLISKRYQNGNQTRHPFAHSYESLY